MRYLALLAFLAFPALAYTPQELLSGKENPFNCPEGKDICTIKRSDAEWITERDVLLNKLLIYSATQLKQCGVKGI